MADSALLLEVVRACATAASPAAFAQAALDRIPTLIPCDHLAYNVVDLVERTVDGSVAPAELDAPSVKRSIAQALARNAHEHPLITYYGRTHDGRALKISDFLSQRQLHRLSLYQELYGPLGVEWQMAISLPVRPPLVVGIALSRARPDFSERERDLLDLLRPHLAQAHTTMLARAEAERTLRALAQRDEVTDGAVILLDAAGRPEAMSGPAAAWLAACDGRSRLRPELPEPLAMWYRAQQQMLGHTAPLSPSPLRLERGGERLTVYLLPDVDGRQALFLRRESRDSPPEQPGAGLGLTRRQQEVLRWVAEGQTNQQVALRLGVSARTVQKHLRLIYDRLGVATRTAAAKRLLQQTRPEDTTSRRQWKGEHDERTR